MKLVLSVNKYEYENYTCIQSFQNIDWNNVEVLIYHSSRDTEVDVIMELSKASKIVEKMIYINQNINSLYYGLFAGFDADIYNDESFLSDESMLDYLVDEYKKTNMNVQPPNKDVETISKFVATVSKESAESLAKLVKNNFWLQSLESSMKNVETALVRTDEANVNMVEMFNKTSDIIDTLQANYIRTTEEIEKLSSYLQELEQKSRDKENNSSLTIFPPFKVVPTAPKTLYVHVCSPCRYLFSFLSAYQNYLKMSKQKNVKMLVCAPKLKQFMIKYDNENFSRLGMDTINIRGIENYDLYVTFEPRNQVLMKFFSMKADIFIVIDMMFGGTLLQGSKVIPLEAISGVSDIKRFKLDPKNCIVPHSGLNTNIVIPTLMQYNYVVQGKNLVPTNITIKRSKYFEKCHDKAYLKLDTLLGV